MARMVFTMFFIACLLIIKPLQGIAAEDSEVTADAKRAPASLMGRFGHKVETHKITTQDGYILEMDRITGPKDLNTTERRPPVLVVHGITMNAGCWVANYPSQSPGFLLADAGFDVWLINTRGVPESNFHKTLSTNDPKFWDWRVGHL
ncbi:lipase lipl-4-like [Haemaphysalis longicornis]